MVRRQLIGLMVVGIGLLSSLILHVDARPRVEGWHEIAWPFPRDGWPAGHAYRCTTSFCGDEIELYVRPKIGFCNCDTGVTDDEEVDRVTDLDLISERFHPLEPGQAVQIVNMPGRMRNYELQMSDGSRRIAVGMAVSRRCDLMVAIVQGKAASQEKVMAAGLQRMALDFLASRDVADWMNSALDGR